MRNTLLMTIAAAVTLTACSTLSPSGTKTSQASMSANTNAAKLETILASKDEAAQARYAARHPVETLAFFGIEPGMTIAEALPGGGWYTKILAPYIGEEGKIIGADYALDMWPHFGGFADAAFIEKKKTWPTDWVKGTEEWRGDTPIEAFAFGDRDKSNDGTVDAVLFIRALHNLARFDDKGSYFAEALADAHALLKTGGVVGVVQHAAPESNSDEWADGSNGYLKKSAVIAKFKAAGFELIGDSDINANPKDQPTSEDIVWRLPPSLGTSGDDPELKAKMIEIGESNRMTLLFKKHNRLSIN